MPLAAGQAGAHATTVGTLPDSDSTMGALAEIIAPAKFDRYLALAERLGFIARLARIAEPVTVTRACRDPRDDTFLELAVAGGADVIVTGDGDLRALDPFDSIAIVTPARFLTTRPE